MTTSHTTGLSEPVGDDIISIGTLAYFRSRFKRRLYDRMIEAFENSGLTQTTLAKRLGLGTDRVCRVLGGPGNLTLDTVSDIMFAAGGAEFDLSVSYPLKKIVMPLTAEIKQAQDQQPDSAPTQWPYTLPDESLNVIGSYRQKPLPTVLTGSSASSWFFQIPHHASRSNISVEDQLKKSAAA